MPFFLYTESRREEADVDLTHPTFTHRPPSVPHSTTLPTQLKDPARYGKYSQITNSYTPELPFLHLLDQSAISFDSFSGARKLFFPFSTKEKKDISLGFFLLAEGWDVVQKQRREEPTGS